MKGLSKTKHGLLYLINYRTLANYKKKLMETVGGAMVYGLWLTLKAFIIRIGF